MTTGEDAAPASRQHWRLLAAALAGFHVAFVIFVLFGALTVLVWPGMLWVHLAAVIWASGTMLCELGCPITTWEKEFLRRAGVDPYPEGFLQHHVLRRVFPPSNARRNHVLLGLAAMGLNAAIYTVLAFRS